MKLSHWVLLVLVSAIGIIGLFVAAGGGGPTTYRLGLLVFAAAVIYDFRLIKRVFDRIDRGE
ncbi:MAG TPA: hypothetical protein VMU82_19535 [Acetobacteraceae bacterium]|nr:hypothetical protein [Acetobacteraceae bacterium]